MTKDRRLWIISLLLLAVAASFWASSRYPSLDAKSSMSGAVALQDSLSFEAVFNTSTAPNDLAQIAYTFGNWVYINWQGMAFGLVLAILLLTAIPLMRDGYSRSRFGSTFIGSLIGIPLGLCVNCSAPMAYGIYKGGGRAETALAAMLSSPTLNVIVIGMSIALLPAYLWATKLGLSLLLIFAFVPLLVRLSDRNQLNVSNLPVEEVHTEPPQEPCLSLTKALVWLVPELLKNALSMLWKMVPLMLLAGLIGAVMVTILPWEQLIDLLPMYNVPLIIAGMCLLALFALILPVPVAFDIILVATLVSAGLPDRYAGILLFALGSFSIYSFLVLAKAQLKPIAIQLGIVIWFLSITSGLISHYWGLWDAAAQKQLWFQVVKQSKGSEYHPPELTYTAINNIEQPQPLSQYPFEHHPHIRATKLNTPSSGSTPGNWFMQRADLGFQADTPPVFWSNMAPYSAFASLAATDLNQDGWPDIVRSGYNGIHIYLNTGGAFQLLKNPTLDSLKRISVLAPADLDNDGDPDLVVALFSGEKYLIFNQLEQRGSINTTETRLFAHPVKLEGESNSYTPAVAIADLDDNGELDVLFGNQTVLDLLNISTEDSHNRLYMQHDRQFRLADLPAEQGATLSVLISDQDLNQHPDVFIGNDFDTPDHYYEYYKHTDRFEAWPVTDIRETTRTTMSIDTADINNDLLLETYIAQVSMESPDKRYLDVERQSSVYDFSYGRLLYGVPNPFGNLLGQPLQTCESHDAPCAARNARTQISAAIRARDISKCSRLPSNLVWQCAAVAVHEFAYRRGRFSHIDIPCENLGEGYPEIAEICQRMRHKNELRDRYDFSERQEDNFAQNSLTNILLSRPTQHQGMLRYTNIAESMGVHYSGWTWNAKFADLDGDQWQDLFVANGWYQMRTDTSNVLFRNRQGQRFDIQTRESGLLDFEPTKSFVYLDIDQDGDLDLVTHNIYGELNAYLNHNDNQHIQFQIADQKGNLEGVGATLIIEYGEEKQLRQIRELKLSGGYQSFDPVIAHFGLGQYRQISSVTLTLADGREYDYSSDFKAGHRYLIKPE